MRLREKRSVAAESFTAKQVEALVDAHATEHEKLTLTFSSLAGANVKLGWNLRDLAAAAAGDEVETRLPLAWDPAALAEVTARIRTRRELRLPARECVRRKPEAEASHCLCLAEAIDAAIASGQATTRDDVLQAARQAHAETWAWLRRRPKPRPEPPSPEPRQVDDRSSKAPKPAPAAVVTETSTRPFRAVRKVRRWYDEDCGAGRIMDRQF